MMMTMVMMMEIHQPHQLTSRRRAKVVEAQIRDFNIYFYLALPLSSSYGKVKRGVVLAYVSTWLCLGHFIYLFAR